MIYEISHRTVYRYSLPVSFSHHLLHLAPRSCPRQVCRRTGLSVTPTPASHSSGFDYFGNPVTYLTLQDDHNELRMTSASVIEVAPAVQLRPEETAAWDTVYDLLVEGRSRETLDTLQYMFPSVHTRTDVDLAGFAAPFFPPGRPVLEAALDLTRYIHQHFVYDPSATTISTPIDEVLASRRGVCQDFAHLEIACFRAVGLPARYVSGYLHTRPPADRPKLIGADASHAWLSIWCPGNGWIDLDPTNNLLVSNDHITLAWGRDFADVSPIKGAIFGGGAHLVEVGVDVTRIDHPER